MKRTSKRAYSYLRFSDRKQAKGDSVRRQLAWGPAICREKGWTLDERFGLHDEGISAFRGLNKTTGALGEFLKAIRKGRVKPGDVLLVESLDRLSREEIDAAWELFRSILKAGVEIYTREPQTHYLPVDLNDLGKRIEVQAFFLRAFNESNTKSMRGREYWQAARANIADRKVHKLCPAWLRLSDDGKAFAVIPEAAKTLKLIYRWAGEGQGINPITARLNHEGVMPIAQIQNKKGEPLKGRRDSWGRSYIAKILSDRSLLGEYQPHAMKDGKRVPKGEAVPGYFPQIIDEATWHRVRQAVKGRGKERGPKGVGIASLFTGMIRDARDGQVMHLTYSTSSRKANCRVLVSYGSRNGEKGSKRQVFPYDAVERAFLGLVRELKASDVLDGDKGDDREDEINALIGKVQELDKKIQTIKGRVLDEDAIDALVSTLEMLGVERKKAAAKLDSLKAEASSAQPNTLGEVQTIAELLRKAKNDEERVALRLKVKARVRSLVSEMWMLVADPSRNERMAQLEIHFHAGGVRYLFFHWTRWGTGQGQVIDAGTDRLKVPIPLSLAAYRTDTDARQFFDDEVAAVAQAMETGKATLLKRLIRESGESAADLAKNARIRKAALLRFVNDGQALTSRATNKLLAHFKSEVPRTPAAKSRLEKRKNGSPR